MRLKNNGRGIAAEVLISVFFDLFRRAGQQDQPGEGIGLAHVRALVRRLGGYMTLKSELGEGTTFIVSAAAPDADGRKTKQHDRTRPDHHDRGR